MFYFFALIPLSSPQKNSVQIGGIGMDANSGLPVPGARVNRPQYGHYFSAGLFGGGISWVLLVAVDKKYLAHLLISNYGVLKVLVCEMLNIRNSCGWTNF